MIYSTMIPHQDAGKGSSTRSRQDAPDLSRNKQYLYLNVRSSMQKQIFGLFFSTAWKYPWRTFIGIFNPIVTVVLASFIGPLIIAQLLENLQAGTLTLDGAWPLIGWYALTQLYGDVLGWRLTLYAIWTMEIAAARDLYERVFVHLTNMSLTFHANRFGGSLVSQTSKLTGSFERFWDTIAFQLMATITSIIATVIILSFFFWQYAVFIAAISIVFGLAVFFGSRFLARLNTLEAQASTAMSGRIADVVANVMAVKAHGSEKSELAEAHTVAEAWRARSRASMWGFLKVSTGYSSLLVVINVTAIIAAVWAAEQHLISIAVVYLALTYTITVARQLWEMNNIMRNYNRIIGDAHDMAEILNTPISITDRSKTTLKIGKGAIHFDRMSFTHEEAGEALFENFSLSIPAGQKVALVGHSGSGKTTFVRLLLRFSDVDSGAITIDKQNIAEVTQASLRRSIAYVPQEPLLFHRSLSENIAYGKPDATEAEIKRAARLAHADEFIQKLPEKYETLVGERGVKLSGGQRQRIAIARAILKDAPILVLDEATSALDSESEKLIQASLKDLMKDRTSIVIAHRLSTIQKMDRILVLENGTITEDGTHAELLKKNGTYATLWSHQSGGFIEE
ncbi:ABC transporter ATP-binding protein [Candidatus Saccharibacteria bacterium]|nr:MAG: ABC transporter ATP-binding protein [Candidatus Saccharibacteria bacterium]